MRVDFGQLTLMEGWKKVNLKNLQEDIIELTNQFTAIDFLIDELLAGCKLQAAKKYKQMKQTKWFDRKFDFASDQNIFPSVMERLSGTPARLEEKMKNISSDIVTKKLDNTWSIKENIGHLSDLEPLWQGRFEDIVNGAIELRPTDLLNRDTDLQNHNETLLEELLKRFREIRKKTSGILENIDEQIVFKSALHPRLKTPMRTMDLFLFVAEHDDHHLARITQLLKMQS